MGEKSSAKVHYQQIDSGRREPEICHGWIFKSTISRLWRRICIYLLFYTDADSFFYTVGDAIAFLEFHLPFFGNRNCIVSDGQSINFL